LIDKPYEKVLWIGRKSADPVLISLNELDEEKLLLDLKESLELDAP
jgi:DNA-directed RNA polymerase subunit K/omega